MNTLITLRPETLLLSPAQITALLPYAAVFGAAVVAILAAALGGGFGRWMGFISVLAGVIGGIYLSAIQIHQPSLLLFSGGMSADTYSCVFNMLFLASAGLTCLVSWRYLEQSLLQHPEYYILTLLSAFGMMTMVSALDLITIFIALEVMSLCVYVLVGFRRADRRSNEAAMKYFILGSAASAVLLYGAALLYGATGSTHLGKIMELVQATPATITPVFTLGAALVVIGFLFKVAAVPFHMWMPDVYEGAPTPVTGFMTTGLKAAAFAAFVRFFIMVGHGKGVDLPFQHHMHDVLWVVAVLTMILGNIVALTQANLKRMLAYSSIAHSGYLLVGILSGPLSEQGFAPVVLYLIAYAAMNLGAFVVLTMVSGKDDSGLNLHDFSGLARRQPWMAFALSVFMFSMAGIPPTAGFAAKYYLLYSAVQAHEIPLVVISVLCSTISVYYYLRVIVYMYMREPSSGRETRRGAVMAGFALAAMVVLTLQVGVLPARFLNAAKKAVTSL